MYRIIKGSLTTLSVSLVLWSLTLYFGKLPNPGFIMLLPVLYSAFTWGFSGSMVSATIAALTVTIHNAGLDFRMDDPDLIARTASAVICYFLMSVSMSILVRRNERMIREAHLEREARLFGFILANKDQLDEIKTLTK